MTGIRAQGASAASGARRTAARFLTVLCCLFMLAAPARQAGAEITANPEVVEQQLKAAYLFKFGGYVEWPEHAFATPATSLTIGVLEAEALAEELVRAVAGRTVGGRSVVVRKISRDEQIGTDVNVLFIGRSVAGSRLAAVLNAVKGRPILTVSESDSAFSQGSMINFVVVDGKVRFEVAPKTAGASDISISARLLAAAYKVL